MKYISLEPFVPSGPKFTESKDLFIALGFPVRWEMEGYIGFGGDGFRFILQHYEQEAFARNFMLSVRVDDIEAFQRMLSEKKLEEKFDIKVGQIINQPYGRELNIIDIAGVCWHFVQ
jgi:hypothetical protein